MVLSFLPQPPQGWLNFTTGRGSAFLTTFVGTKAHNMVARDWNRWCPQTRFLCAQIQNVRTPQTKHSSPYAQSVPQRERSALFCLCFPPSTRLPRFLQILTGLDWSSPRGAPTSLRLMCPSMAQEMPALEGRHQAG